MASAGLIGAGIGASALGNIFGSLAGGEGLSEAMDIFEDYYGKAIDEYNLSHRFAKKRYKEIEGMYEPYRAAGLDTLRKFVSTLALPASGSPLYQWRSKQGNEAIDRAMASRGLYGSTSSIKARSDLNQALTGEETDKLYGRLQNALQLLGHYGTQGVTGAKEGLLSSRWRKGESLASTYKELASELSGLTAQQGAQEGALYSSLGQLPLQGYGLYSMLNSPLMKGQ